MKKNPFNLIFKDNTHLRDIPEVIELVQNANDLLQINYNYQRRIVKLEERNKALKEMLKIKIEKL